MKTPKYCNKTKKVGGKEAQGKVLMVGVMIFITLFFINFINAFVWDDSNVAYWKLDETSGILKDMKGNVNLSVIDNTPVYGANGKLNKAITWNSNGDTFGGSDNGKLDFGNFTDFTLNFWINVTSSVGDEYFFSSKLYNTPGNESVWDATVSTDGGGYYCQISNPLVLCGGAGYTSIGGSFSSNSWIMYTYIRNNTGKDTWFFKNGTFIQKSTTTTPYSQNASFVRFGDSRPALDRYPDATLDEFGIWNRSLSQQEILELYNGGAGLEYNNNQFFVELNSPINYYNTTTSLITFNISALSLNSGRAIKNVSLYLDGVLNETNTSGVNGTYIFTKYVSSGTHNWSILAYDNQSQGSQSETRTINIGIYENSRTYSTPVLEGTTQSYVLNISTGSAVTSAYLNYNGTLKLASISAGTFTTLTSSFTLPQININTNVSLFWQVYTSVGNWNSTASNQTINNFAIDNCTANHIVLYNFTIADEITQLNLSGITDETSGKINLQIYPYLGKTAFLNYSTWFNQTNPFAICMNSSLSSSDKFSIDVQLEYDSLNHAKEYYYFQNDTIDSSYKNKNITLYDLNDTFAQTFRIIFSDSSGIPVEDAIIEIHRKYIDEGLFKIVEIANTDKDGETQAKLQLNDVIYTFVVKKYGHTIATFNKKFVRCDNYLYNICEIKLNSFSSYMQTDDYTKGDDFEFTFDYNSTTRTISTTFNIPSGNSSLIVLNATLFDNLGTTLACSDSITSSSGTLNCVIPNSIGKNSSVYAQIFKDGVYQAGGTVKLDESPSSIYGASLVFLLLFLYLTLIGMAVGDSPMIAGIFLILGVVIAIALNMVYSKGFIGAGATVLWFIIAIILVLVKGGKRT